MGRGTRGYSQVGLDGFGSCAKYILFIFNLLVLVGGLAITILGAIAVATDDYHVFQDFSDNNLFKSAAFMQIVVGSVIVLFSFLGCCGAIKESKAMLLTYGVLTLLVLIVVVAAAAVAIFYKDDVEDAVRKELKKKMQMYGAPGDSATQAWDNLQKQGKCCGIDQPDDWLAYNLPNGRYPKSCCESESTCNQNDPGSMHDKGCIKLMDEILSFSSVLGYVAIAFAVILLLGVIFAFCVGCSL
ncbi:unnamed protein product [Notodromas monacha]|uniref:Tetraspanin n=1 Tax=Notodromas monacha TaxID=399045 RepID=A0A7R9BG20_9CRUS|nr:unnamed protein product [Notodromas monacha]CAG0913486.1 unnamed protein product [Notodromas monacha]